MTQALNISYSLDSLLADIAAEAGDGECSCATCDSDSPVDARWIPYSGMTDATAQVCDDCAEVLSTASF